MGTDQVKPDEMEPGEKIKDFNRSEFRHASSLNN